MPYLMHIAVDNPFRLKKRINYFSYRGTRFKFIQNDGRRWSDVLVTLVDSMSGPGVQIALAAAGEFVSALAFHFDVGMTVRHVGGPGKPKSFRLRSARCQVRRFPELPFRGNIRGHSLATIANVETAEQRAALTLYREAQSSNKPALSILWNWQVMEVGGGNAVSFVNRTAKKDHAARAEVADEIKGLAAPINRLGEHLEEEFRHAIAHIRRKPGRKALKFDDDEESTRLYRGSSIIRHFARLYIQRELGLNSNRYLVRKRGRGFPSYEDLSTIENAWYVSVD